jgi:hypothetical protein
LVSNFAFVTRDMIDEQKKGERSSHSSEGTTWVLRVRSDSRQQCTWVAPASVEVRAVGFRLLLTSHTALPRQHSIPRFFIIHTTPHADYATPPTPQSHQLPATASSTPTQPPHTPAPLFLPPPHSCQRIPAPHLSLHFERSRHGDQ